MKASILFVDDDPGITHMLARLFHHSEYWVKTVNSAITGLQLMDGFTFLQQAHITQPIAIKLMFSGRMEAKDYHQKLEHDLIHQFILKPCFDDAFMAYIDEAVTVSLQRPKIDRN
ncbi:hypothetical protein AB835_08930 [Candidatus Endobugula sertula]|uniref:Response regulatory domain-containing protein n=1 Tax=Candidatus Endobugula sertula TaxID=62101 RepID=A0A1D2QPD0_9GAMM|nr:hypothetical protein AB835_08930 [Candidatus Endobugula sertula]